MAHGFWKPYGLGQLFRVFSSFSSLFYIFSSLLGIFAILEEFWIFLEEKRGFLAFWRPFSGIFRVFKGNMVGKWTNEPCSGVDEVVNTFWVLTMDNSILM